MSKVDEKLVLDIKRATDEMSNWQAKRHLYAAIVSRLESLGHEPFFSGCLYTNFTGNREKLIDTIRVLRTSGLKSETYPKEGSPSFSAWYENPDRSVRVFLRFASTVCRRVQVGTEMIEQPIYRIECGEESPPEEPEEAVLKKDAPDQVGNLPGLVSGLLDRQP